MDAVICTLGTTLADAGSRDAFRRVDHDYPLQVARLARRHGAGTFALNSALGANARSSIFYNRVKGELEAALAALDYPALVLVRPGLIDGDRSQWRPGERIAADAVVVEGTSSVDESLLTGEALPVDKQAGDTLTGGAINAEGALTVRTTAIGAETTLARIIARKTEKSLYRLNATTASISDMSFVD